MKKIILTLILCPLPLMAFAEKSCPKGFIECPAKCGMCVDENNDGKCDYTQSKPEKKITKPAKKSIPIRKKTNCKITHFLAKNHSNHKKNIH